MSFFSSTAELHAAQVATNVRWWKLAQGGKEGKTRPYLTISEEQQIVEEYQKKVRGENTYSIRR
jgi:hypothetical protein